MIREIWFKKILILKMECLRALLWFLCYFLWWLNDVSQSLESGLGFSLFTDDGTIWKRVGNLDFIVKKEVIAESGKLWLRGRPGVLLLLKVAGTIPLVCIVKAPCIAATTISVCVNYCTSLWTKASILFLSVNHNQSNTLSILKVQTDNFLEEKYCQVLIL